VREVGFNEIVDGIHADLKVPIPKGIIRFVVRHLLKRMMSIMEKGKDRMIFGKCDIGHIYPEYDREGLCREFADLDETHELTRKEKGIQSTVDKEISYPPLRNKALL
tara:strand:- start:58 stop:378 length:321 start_codon:yes stop_codon:yes gene_type:complete